MIEVKNLSKNYGKLEVLKSLDLSIQASKIHAILGPNGSGKTTLIKCFLGMVLPNEGSISVNEQIIKGKYEYRKDLDYLPQIANFPPNLKVAELIAMIRTLRQGQSKEEELVERFRIQPYLNKKFSNLSGGTKQKVNLAVSLMFDSPLVILDEPTTGLDPVAMLELKQVINELRAEGKTILITSHIMSFVEEVADDIIFILDGKIYFQGSSTTLSEQTGKKNLEEAIAQILAEHDS